MTVFIPIASAPLAHSFMESGWCNMSIEVVVSVCANATYCQHNRRWNAVPNSKGKDIHDGWKCS